MMYIFLSGSFVRIHGHFYAHIKLFMDISTENVQSVPNQHHYHDDDDDRQIRV